MEEVDEEDFVDDAQDSYSSAASEAHAELKKEIAAATASSGRQDEARYAERPRNRYAQDYDDVRRYRRPARGGYEDGYPADEDRSYRDDAGYARRGYRDPGYDNARYGSANDEEAGYVEPRRGYRRDYGYEEPSYRDDYEADRRRDAYSSYQDAYEGDREAYPSYREEYEPDMDDRRGGRYRDERSRGEEYDRRRYRQAEQEPGYSYPEDAQQADEEPDLVPSDAQPVRRQRTARPYANIPSAPRKTAEPEEEPREEEEAPRRMLGMPRYSEDQLRQQAADAGDQVDVVRDDVTKVALFDYSDDLFEEAAQDMGEEDDF